MLDGRTLSEPLPRGEVELEFLRKDSLAVLKQKLFEAGIPIGSWLLVTRHDEVRVNIINLESHATLAGIFYPTFAHFVTDSGMPACRPDYTDMYVDRASRPEVIEALEEYVSKVGDEGFPDLERIDPLRSEELGEALPEHLAWMGDQAKFPSGTRAFAECGYCVKQLV